MGNDNGHLHTLWRISDAFSVFLCTLVDVVFILF